MGFFELFQVVCLGFFLCVVVGQTVRLQVRTRTNAIALSVSRKGLLGIMEVMLFLVVNVWIAVVLLYVLPLEPRPVPWLFALRLFDSLANRVAGAVIIVAAYALQLSALVALGDSWRLGIDRTSTGPLVTRGIYALTRNPIYLFFDFYFIGTFLINGALVFLVFALLVVANLHYQILKEEQFLTAVHGQAYHRYRARVGRYLTWRRARAPDREWSRQPASD